MIWIKTETEMPPKGEYIIVKTPYCKYPCCTAYWNGISFRSADNDHEEIYRVDEWCKIIL